MTHFATSARAQLLGAALVFFVAMTLGAGGAEAQSLSLSGGMQLLLGPPEGQVLGPPQEGPPPAPPASTQPQTVYIVETQAPPGYGQPGYAPAYGQPGYTGMPSAEAQASQRAQAESNGRIPRLIFEPLIGYGVGVSLGAIGLLIGAVAGGCFDLSGDEDWGFDCAVGAIAGFYAGALLGIPLGVAWAGSWFDGMGNFGASLLGTLAGTGLAVLIAALVQSYDAVFGAALLPLAGGIVGYELSSSSAASAGLAGVALAPTLDRGTVTGGTAGVRFAF